MSSFKSTEKHASLESIKRIVHTSNSVDKLFTKRPFVSREISQELKSQDSLLPSYEKKEMVSLLQDLISIVNKNINEVATVRKSEPQNKPVQNQAKDNQKNINSQPLKKLKTRKPLRNQQQSVVLGRKRIRRCQDSTRRQANSELSENGAQRHSLKERLKQQIFNNYEVVMSYKFIEDTQ